MRHVNNGFTGTTIDIDATGKAYIPVGRQARDTAGTWAGVARKRVANMGRGTPQPMPRASAGGLPPAGALVPQSPPGAMGGGALARNAGRAGMGLGKLAGRVAPVAFAGLDYAAGKAEGEDDFRALAGAGGAAAGGWGGAATGAAIGTAILPGVGTVVGGLIGGGIGSFAGGWGADRVDDVVRGRPQNDRDNAPDTRLGMMGGVANAATGGNGVNPWAVGKGLAVGAGVLGTGVGLTAAGNQLKSIYDDTTGQNEYNYRTGQNVEQFQGYSEDAITRDLERTSRFAKDAGRFKLDLEKEKDDQKFRNDMQINAQQYASQERVNTDQLRASEAENALREFNQSQNVAAQRAASILNTRFY